MTKKPEDRPCEEGEVWAEAFANTGIGGCFKEKLKILNRFHVPLNKVHFDFDPSLINRQNGDHHEYCGRCFRNGRVHLCCEGDGIDPR